MHLLRPLTATLLVLAACNNDDPATSAETTGPGTGTTAEPDPTTDASDTGGSTSTGEDPTTSTSTGTSTGDDDSTTGDETTGAPDPLMDGAPTPNTDPDAQDVDVYAFGNHYWFVVDPDELVRMNKIDNQGDDIYTPGGSAATYANHMFVSTPGDDPQIADYGKVEVRVVGQSTFRPWTPQSIPSLKVDTDEFTDGLEVGGVEHLRFNNSLVGAIYRERLALGVYAALDYPAPRATHGWVGSSVWGRDIEVPYTMVEVYKRDFCEANSEALAGGCPNIYEFVGDLAPEVFANPDNCQISECDTTRALELTDKVAATPKAAGFKAALADHVAWDAFHRFQCISWLLWTGDDALHNTNNVVLVERQDGRFQYLPYSVDISAGQEWYKDTSLYGANQLALGCQADPACWDDTISECEDVVAEFVAADPVAMVDDLHAELAAADMLRDGDEGRYKEVRAWYEKRAATALADLDNFRDMPCGQDQLKCGGMCVTLEQCILECEPGSLQCGTECAPEGMCKACDFPFEPCGDSSCKPFGHCG